MKTIAGIFLLFIFYTSISAQQKGTVIKIEIPAPSLAGSLLDTSDVQKVAVYLPPTYNLQPDKYYPVVYFLPGYGIEIEQFTDWGLSGFLLGRSMDNLTGQGKIKEMIMVIPNGVNRLYGSCYVNSAVTGNWEDFITEDVIHYIDNNYRTLGSNEARAIGGHSMGGSGALNLSMKHPEIYCVGYGISPGLFDENGLNDMYSFSSENTIHSFLAIQESIDTLSANKAHSKYLTKIDELWNSSDWPIVAFFAYGSAFAPSPDSIAPYIYYPYSDSDTGLILDTLTWEKWDNGYGNLDEKTDIFHDNLVNLKCIGIDCGTNDNYKWITRGSAYYDQLLSQKKIPHLYYTHTGNHSSRLKERIEKFFLEICDTVLLFDTTNFNHEAEIIRIMHSKIVSSEIDNALNTIHIKLKAETNLANFIPVIYLSPGATVTPESGTAFDITSGPISLTVVAEDGIMSEQWTLTAEVEPTAIDRKIEAEQIRLNILSGPNKLEYYNLNDFDGGVITIFNTEGKVFISRNINAGESGTINLDNIAPGIYFYQVKLGESFLTGKLMIP